MADMSQFLDGVKKAALDAVEAAKPVEVCFGTVQSVSPLSILVEQKLPLGREQLSLSQNVTDHSKSCTISWRTQEADGHTHSVTGTKTITINNGLKVGDHVWLIRQQEGQKYLVVDRVIDA